MGNKLRKLAPDHCFLCGNVLEECGMGFLECIECKELFLPYINQDSEQCLALCNPD